MSIFIWVAVGLGCGLVANLAAKRYGVLEDAIVGVAGSIAVGWAFIALTGVPMTRFSSLDIAVALAGSLLFIALARGLTGGHSTI